MGLWFLGERRKAEPIRTAGISRRLRVAAENLGPTYIKLGQIVSSGEGIFPSELVAEFKRCRDQVKPEPWAVVHQVIEEELGRSPESVFATIDREPLAAASIAQVHAATLIGGTEVVIKVQRPTVARLVQRDLAVMSWLAPHLVGRLPVAALANPPALVELFAETIVEELDFRLEAENMLDIAATFAKLGQRDYVIPRPHPTLVTRRMLVMERMNGFNFSDVQGMHKAGIDTEAVVRTGMIGFLEGCMMHGIFHGDLHGGNLLVMSSGKVALLDFGITARLTEPKRLALLDGAIATLAPDLDLFAEIEGIALLFAEKHGERIMAQLGLKHQDGWEPDMAGLKAGYGLDETTEHFTHRDVQARRAEVREKFERRGSVRRARRKREFKPPH